MKEFQLSLKREAKMKMVGLLFIVWQGRGGGGGGGNNFVAIKW